MGISYVSLQSAFDISCMMETESIMDSFAFQTMLLLDNWLFLVVALRWICVLLQMWGLFAYHIVMFLRLVILINAGVDGCIVFGRYGCGN